MRQFIESNTCKIISATNKCHTLNHVHYAFWGGGGCPLLGLFMTQYSHTPVHKLVSVFYMTCFCFSSAQGVVLARSRMTVTECPTWFPGITRCSSMCPPRDPPRERTRSNSWTSCSRHLLNWRSCSVKIDAKTVLGYNWDTCS